MTKHIFTNEHKLGTCKMVDELEDAFLKSCKHNKVKPSDLKYFRQYVWNLFAMMSNALTVINARQEEK